MSGGERRHLSYGGYLPLELPLGGQGPFDAWPHLATNSAKSALHLLLEALEVQRIWLPSYLCPSVKTLLQELVPEVHFYAIGEDLLPQLSPEEVAGDAWVYLVNYFGLVDISDLGFPHAILDEAHAFYEAPVLAPDVWNLYSTKKFFGVPDGGYLVGKELPSLHIPQLEPELVHEHFSYLVTSSEVGTEKDYQVKKDADRYLGTRVRGISEISEAMMRGLDYGAIAQKRCENAQVLHECLGAHNQLADLVGEALARGAVPYIYPFLPQNLPSHEARAGLRQELISQRVYVPLLWADTAEPEHAPTWPWVLSTEVSFLPIDQRYDTEDMDEVASIVLQTQASLA